MKKQISLDCLFPKSSVVTIAAADCIEYYALCDQVFSLSVNHDLKDATTFKNCAFFSA